MWERVPTLLHPWCCLVCVYWTLFRAEKIVLLHFADGSSTAPASTYEHNNATDDVEDQMLISLRQSTGSLTCKPEIKASCEMQGKNCTMHLWVHRFLRTRNGRTSAETNNCFYRGFPRCFVPSQCSEPCQNDGLCFNGRWVLWHLFPSFASLYLFSLPF